MSDYVDLVCIRVLSRDIRRLLYCELLRCSGIHLDESALMTELCGDGTHLNKYYSSLIKQTTGSDLFHALSFALSSCLFSTLSFFSSSTFSLVTLSFPLFYHLLLPTSPAFNRIPHSSPLVISTYHSQLKLLRHLEFLGYGRHTGKSECE